MPVRRAGCTEPGAWLELEGPRNSGSGKRRPPVATRLLQAATAADLGSPSLSIITDFLTRQPAPCASPLPPRPPPLPAASRPPPPRSRAASFTDSSPGRRRQRHRLCSGAASRSTGWRLSRLSGTEWRVQFGGTNLRAAERNWFQRFLWNRVFLEMHGFSTQFWTQPSLDKNKALVEYLKQYGAVRTDKVAEVMETIDRALFVPEGTPYVDSPMPIGFNATISAPHMHATCLELLKDHLRPGMHALDIGSGSGYLTACFAMMVGPEGRAVGIEHIPEIIAFSIENVQRSAAAPLLKDGSLSFHVADGRLGFPDAAPYDAIHVGAAASEIPQPLLDQLKLGGRMVIPVGTYFQDLQVVDKNADGSISVRNDASVRYVPLTSRSAQLQDP